jgi:hypothetical protein
MCSLRGNPGLGVGVECCLVRPDASCLMLCRVGFMKCPTYPKVKSVNSSDLDCSSCLFLLLFLTFFPSFLFPLSCSLASTVYGLHLSYGHFDSKLLASPRTRTRLSLLPSSYQITLERMRAFQSVLAAHARATSITRAASTWTSTQASSSRRPLHRPLPPLSLPRPLGSIPHRNLSSTSPSPARKDHYAALKLPRNASRQQIKARFYEVR